MAIKKAKIFTVTGVNGGCGKTTTTLNLAGIFSKKNLKTLIIDLDLCNGTIGYSLKVEETSDMFKILEDLNNNNFKNLDDYVSKYNDYIDVLTATKDPRYAIKVNARHLNIVVDKYSYAYDVILIDTTNEFNATNLTAFDLSDELVYIINNDSATLRNMRTMITILGEMKRKNYMVILNESINNTRTFFSKSDIKNIIKKNVDYVIPASFHIKNIDSYILDGSILSLDSRIIKRHKKDIDKIEMIANYLLKEKKRGE